MNSGCDRRLCPVSGRAQQCQKWNKVLVRTWHPAHDDVEKIIVVKGEQLPEPCKLTGIEQLKVPSVEAFEDEIEFEQPAPAMPSQLAELAVGGRGRHLCQTMRLTKRSLICLIARLGLRPLGQTSTQFMIE